MFRSYFVLFLSLNLLLGLSSVQAQPVLDLTEFATGFTRPINIVSDGGDRMFVVEQRGVIKITDLDGNVEPTPFMDIMDRVLDTQNEQGLLGMAFPPDFATSQVFYVNYTTGSGSGRTHVSRFSVDSMDTNKGDKDSEEVLLDFDQPFTNHNGGHLVFGPDGYLYISTGDGGSGGDPQGNGQRKNTLLGKILRIDVDTMESYRIPPDNPYVGQEGRTEEIWSLGLRNPWRFSFDRETGDMWIGDVGQGAREEVDFEPAGSPGGVNYGWRCFEGDQPFINIGCNESYTFPIFQYPHNNTTGGFSITGGYAYRGGMHPYINGTYIFCDYVSGNFWTSSVEDETGDWQTFRQNGLKTSISSFGEDPNGELYVTRLNTGEIFKVGASCPDIAFSVMIAEHGDSLVADRMTGTFQWFFNGNAIVGANDYFYIPNEDGDYSLEVIINDMGCIYESITNTITIMTPTGIDLQSIRAIELFPNPVVDKLQIELSDISIDQVQSWQLTNIQGKQFQPVGYFEENRLVVDVSGLPRGYYQIRIFSTGDQYAGRFLAW